MDELIQEAARCLAQSKHVLALTGAGISTESGIPDFRSPGGLWTRVDPGEFSIDRFLQNPGRFWRIHMRLKASGDFNMAAADPNPGHRALARLEQLGKLKCLITQNVDNLHQRAGSVDVVEYHGNLLRAVCLKCRAREPIEYVEARLEEGAEEVPRCRRCDGLLKPDAVFFGEAIPSKALVVSQVEAQKCDVLLVVGTSLQVYPAAEIPVTVKAKQPPAVVIEVNLEPSSLCRRVTDMLLLGSSSEILSKLMEGVEKELSAAAAH
jgi:NAD-dependent deacetylase